mmetsp:Transcript_65027/g.173904  ORF Transcript_65027/g.173904 Transcript_65027/m.173904 type:complete len:204 (+) Transcript_65027:452-1063(+)
MAAGDRHICDTHVTLVASSQLQHLLRQRDDVQTAASMLLRVADHVLQHDEGRPRPRHLHERHRLQRIGLVLHVGRIGGLAELARQRPEEVGAAGGVGEVQAPSDPVPQAAEVDVLDGALAQAGRDEGVALAWSFQQADAAERVRELLLTVQIHAAHRAGIIEPQLGLHLASALELPHAELEPAELDDVALVQMVDAARHVPDH